MSRVTAKTRSIRPSSLDERAIGLATVEKSLAIAAKRAMALGGGVLFTVFVAPTGGAVVGPITPTGGSQPFLALDDEARSSARLDQSLAAARERGRQRAAEILAGKDMLSADQMAELLGTTRMTVNSKRRSHHLLGLEGAKRGVRYPQWQIGEDGKPFAAVPALFERLGGSPWAVYRFLVQRHAELDGLTGREALARGRGAETIEAAASVAEAFS